MGSLPFRPSQMGFQEKPKRIIPFHKHALRSLVVGSGYSPKISCGLRGGPRKPLWRSRVLSTEAIQTVQSLKLAKSTSKLDDVFGSRLNRLLKADLLDTLKELQRQNEWELALMVFDFVRKEGWNKPDSSIYCDMIFMLGKNKLIDIAESLFSELKKEGLQPDTRAYTEMIGAYLQVGMFEKAIEAYGAMKKAGCVPDKLTFTILIRNLENAGEEKLASTVKRIAQNMWTTPRNFLQSWEGNIRRRDHLSLSERFHHLSRFLSYSSTVCKPLKINGLPRVCGAESCQV